MRIVLEQKDITVLAIESSCDETAAAVVVNGRKVLSNILINKFNYVEMHSAINVANEMSFSVDSEIGRAHV